MKKIALVNDLSGFGRCSLTAAIPVICAMGLQACPLPTAILSAQTGFSNYFCDDYTDKMDVIIDTWSEMNIHFDGIHSGYLASPLQIEKVLRFLNLFQTPQTIYLADPVLGDNGVPIKSFNESLLHGMRLLCEKSTVCTPNLTELCLLTDTNYKNLISYATSPDYTNRIAEIAQNLLQGKTNQTIVVTGIIRHTSNQTYIGNLAINSCDTIYVETVFTGKSFSGTGDLFASILCGSLVRGDSIHDAMHLAANFLQPAIEEACAANLSGKHGVPFENYLSILCCHEKADF